MIIFCTLWIIEWIARVATRTNFIKTERVKDWATRILIALSLILSATIVTQAQELRPSPNDLAQPALETPVILSSPLPHYNYDKLDYGMTIGIDQTDKGTIWACWVGGGDNEDAFFVLNRSKDKGKTWSEPIMAIDPHSPKLDLARRTLVGALWRDPLNRLWLFFDQGMTYFDGRSGVWSTMCENPDDDNPTWSTPVRIWHGCTLNKPSVLSNGTWVLPISLWDREKIKAADFKKAFPELDSLRMAHLFISVDQGVSWQRQGGVAFPLPQFDEHHILERKDGTLWMTARTRDGIWESVSSDMGKTWSAPKKYMEHIGSRHFLRPLKSGNWLLIKHGELKEKTKTRSKLLAYISDDEGRSWKGGLMLDERRGISYPDGFQDKNGTIFISYDRNRDTDGEMLLIKFTEKEVLNKRFSKKSSGTKIIISKPEGLDKLPAPSTLSTSN